MTPEPEVGYVRITIADIHNALTRVETEVLGIRHRIDSMGNQTLDHEGRLRLIEERRVPLPLVPVVAACIALGSLAVAVLAIVTR